MVHDPIPLQGGNFEQRGREDLGDHKWPNPQRSQLFGLTNLGGRVIEHNQVPHLILCLNRVDVVVTLLSELLLFQMFPRQLVSCC